MSLASTMMDSTAAVQRAKISQAADRSTTQTFSTIIASGLPCSYQEGGGSSIKDLYAQRNIFVDGVCYFMDDPGCEANDRLQVTQDYTGKTYTLIVQGNAESDTHGILWQVPVTRIRPPQ